LPKIKKERKRNKQTKEEDKARTTEIRRENLTESRKPLFFSFSSFFGWPCSTVSRLRNRQCVPVSAGAIAHVLVCACAWGIHTCVRCFWRGTFLFS